VHCETGRLLKFSVRSFSEPVISKLLILRLRLVGCNERQGEGNVQSAHNTGGEAARPVLPAPCLRGAEAASGCPAVDWNVWMVVVKKGLKHPRELTRIKYSRGSNAASRVRVSRNSVGDTIGVAIVLPA
jgi:hypothetical protein